MRRNVTLTIATVLLVSAATVASAQTLPRFRVTNLSATPGAALCSPRALNDAGVIVGECGTDGTMNWGAVVWRDGVASPLGKLPKGNYAGASAINSTGIIVGDGDTGDYRPRAFVTYNGSLLELKASGVNVRAAGISDTGIVFGDLIKGFDASTWNPVFWTQEPGKPDRYRTTLLPFYNDGGDATRTGAYLLASNKSGQAVGWLTGSVIGQIGGFWNNDAAHAVVPLLPLPTGNHSIAWALNDLGQAVGESNVPGAYTRAVMWQNDTAHSVVDLGTLPGDLESNAMAINTAGQIVGTSSTTIFQGGSTRAFFYQGSTMVELATLVDPTNGTWQIDSVFGINNAGQIIASGVSNGQRMNVLLTPVR